MYIDLYLSFDKFRKNDYRSDTSHSLSFSNIFPNPFKPEFTIKIVTHYKPASRHPASLQPASLQSASQQDASQPPASRQPAASQPPACRQPAASQPPVSRQSAASQPPALFGKLYRNVSLYILPLG